MLSHSTRSRAFVNGLACLVVATGIVLVSGSPTAAAPPANLIPDGSTESGNPVLSWNRSSATAKHDVEISVSDALEPIEPPSFSGVAAARETLTADPGTWPGSRSYTYQWFVAGLAVASADDNQYVVRSRDAGRPVKVRVTATTAGYQPGTAFSLSRAVAKLPTTTTASLARKVITHNARPVINVTVSVKDYGLPLGDIQVKKPRNN